MMRFLLLLLAMLPFWGATAQALDAAPLVIHTGERARPLPIDVAETPEQQAHGLMFRQTLPDDYGMLFPMQGRPTAMWMKNTPVSLDMVFIGPDGKVTGVAPHTTPLSETIIPSPGPVIAVLEVKAGVAETLGLAPGVRVSHPRLIVEAP